MLRIFLQWVGFARELKVLHGMGMILLKQSKMIAVGQRPKILLLKVAKSLLWRR
jgi:hypothetical protein